VVPAIDKVLRTYPAEAGAEAEVSAKF
jgi:hypothetical protein